jgi:hypothetical protein
MSTFKIPVLIQDDEELHCFLIPEKELPKKILKMNSYHIEGNYEYFEDRALIHKHFGIGLGKNQIYHASGEPEYEKLIKKTLKNPPIFEGYKQETSFQLDPKKPVIIITLSSDT